MDDNKVREQKYTSRNERIQTRLVEESTIDILTSLVDEGNSDTTAVSVKVKAPAALPKTLVKAFDKLIKMAEVGGNVVYRDVFDKFLKTRIDVLSNIELVGGEFTFRYHDGKLQHIQHNATDRSIFLHFGSSYIYNNLWLFLRSFVPLPLNVAYQITMTKGVVTDVIEISSKVIDAVSEYKCFNQYLEGRATDDFYGTSCVIVSTFGELESLMSLVMERRSRKVSRDEDLELSLEGTC